MGGIRVLSLLGVLIALTGGAMLVLPRASRAVLRLVVGVRVPQGRHERIAAWLLVALGLAIVMIGRVLR